MFGTPGGLQLLVTQPRGAGPVTAPPRHFRIISFLVPYAALVYRFSGSVSDWTGGGWKEKCVISIKLGHICVTKRWSILISTKNTK